MGAAQPKQPPPDIKRDECLTRFFEIDTGFWNCQHDLFLTKVGIPINIGNHMSLCRLASGGIIAIDGIALDADAEAELQLLTQNGVLLEAVIFTHPFHSLGINWFHERYPPSIDTHSPKWYGCPRHLKIAPHISWTGSLGDCKIRQLFEPELQMRIPSGAEFVNPVPPSSNHFSSVLVFHKASKCVHCDDTFMFFDNPTMLMKIFGFKDGSMHFHPSMKSHGLYPTAEAPLLFITWLEQLLLDWDFEHLATAHKGVCFQDAKVKVSELLDSARKPLEQLAEKKSEEATERALC